MKKSLRLKLSVALLSTILVTLLVSVILNKAFLVDYYISGKQKSLVNVFHQINQIYITLNNSEEVSDDKKSLIEGFAFPGILGEKIEDLSLFIDMELAIEQLSQDNNINILIYT